MLPSILFKSDLHLSRLLNLFNSLDLPFYNLLSLLNDSDPPLFDDKKMDEKPVNEFL